MKFWELMSIARDEVQLIDEVATSHPEWRSYGVLLENFSSSVKTQNRAALDVVLDNGFVHAVLGKMQRSLFLSTDKWLRSWQVNQNDKVIPISEAFKSYGANVLEAVFERGAVKIKD